MKRLNMQEFYDVIKAPDAVLKETAHKIEDITNDITDQVERMVRTMYRDAGIGLAANQVAILNRVFVMDLPEGSWQYNGEVDGILNIEASYKSGKRESEPTKSATAFINPEIIWESDQKSVYEEGCLSIPGQYADIIRPASVRVKYQTVSGDTKEEEFEGLHSHCVQHEIDHLNGVLFIDYLSSLKRNMILRRMKKYNKEHKD